MKAIDFVVRENAGGLQRGTVPSGAKAHDIQAGAGQQISLNLRQIDMQTQVRSGNDLVITLTDGREITINNYFNAAGTPNRLFISADGYLNEVAFVDAGAGELYAQYGPTEQWGKWSPSDDLIYLGRTELAGTGYADDEVSLFPAPLLGAAGLLGGGGAAAAAAVVGGAAVLGTSGGGDGEGGGGGEIGGDDNDRDLTREPYVNDPDSSSNLGGDDAELSATVSGGGTPGDAVIVTLGDQQIETVIDMEGHFVCIFEGENFPADGTYEAVVTVVTGDGEIVLDGPGFVIDTTPPLIEVTGGTVSVDDFFNAVSFADGVTISGNGEAGASILATIGGIEQMTIVGADGTWSVSWAAGSLEGGEYSTGLTIMSADAFGNTTTVTDTVLIDTVSEVTIDTANVETDGTVNAVEREDGVTLTGTAQAGSTVVVTFGTGSHEATVDASGNWSVNFAMSEVPTGEMQAEVTAVATDAMGNSSSATGMVDIDTLVRDFAFTGSTGGADGVINAAEAEMGLVMTGTTEPGSTVMVTFGSATHAATVAANGSWTVNFAAGEIPTGTQTAVMTAVATDIAGNVDTINRNVEIDRDGGILTISPAPIEGDDIINELEASDGVVITGTSNPNAVVTVTLAGVSKTVNADAAGNWQANYSNAEVEPGVYTAQISATTTDPAGNTLNASDSVEVDTRVDNLDVRASIVEGDGVINGAERIEGGGVQVTGTTEVGSTSVIVTLNGVSVPATVAANGNWTANYTSAQVTEGTYTASVSVQATDRAGNTATTSDVVFVDTEVVPLNMTSGAGGVDGTVNIAEAATGIDLGGQVEVGSQVVVNFDGTNHTALVDTAGNWSVTIPPSAIRTGSYNAVITVSATDAVGNVDTISDTLAIDTAAPEGPVIESLIEGRVGFRGISTDLTTDDLDVYQVQANGSVTEVSSASENSALRNETDIVFNPDVPDGSHLVVTATDGAQNTTGTYVVLDDGAANSTVAISNPALGNYNIETVDLSFAEEARLTIDEASLLALSGNSNELLVMGGSDDTLTIAGAVRQGSDGAGHTIYGLGSEGKVIVEDDVNVIT
ncbi:putative RTX family exoprotein [Sulfitobacter noctilucae]|uniref:Ig-like domain-containing protein n=1 Tax=Sulfitobacter noctilucae TaxID=1342302 RepID=UPI0004694E96|nr:Ig-like domain-containing protein [Sulfitobacter noctilucae]KIN61755.1 putative RTX family exoprotein [Sulfitobacter noctilucae]